MEHMERYCSTLFTIQYTQKQTFAEFTDTTNFLFLEYEYGFARGSV